MNCRSVGWWAVATWAMAGCAFRSSPVPNEKNDVLQYVLMAPVPLSRAVTLAEEPLVGKAISAELVRQDGRMLYKVLVTAQGKLRTVAIDPATGAVVHITP